jgi:hypothetical protein
MLAALVAAVAAAAPAPTPGPVTHPVWLAGPSKAMMLNCTTGYLTDPSFGGEAIVMGCTVQPDGTLDQCLVKETKRAEAAGVQDVAVCAAAGFRMGPVDKQGKPTAGRPVLIPMGIATVAPPADPQTQPAAPPTQP